MRTGTLGECSQTLCGSAPQIHKSRCHKTAWRSNSQWDGRREAALEEAALAKKGRGLGREGDFGKGRGGLARKAQEGVRLARKGDAWQGRVMFGNEVGLGEITEDL